MLAPVSHYCIDNLTVSVCWLTHKQVTQHVHTAHTALTVTHGHIQPAGVINKDAIADYEY